MATDCTFGYPASTDFDTAAQNLVDYVMGTGTVDTTCALHCAWVVQGYVQNLIFPDTHSPVMTAAPSSASDIRVANKQDLCNAINHLRDCKKKGAAASGFDWQTVLTMVIQIILQLLQPKPAPTPA